MQDVVLASNRGPLSFAPGPDGSPVATGSAGGLATALHALLAGSGAMWVAAALGDADREAAALGMVHEDGLRIVTVESSPEDFALAYDVVANATLWFCHHHLFDLVRSPRLDRGFRDAWDAYRRVNQDFSRAIAEAAPVGARVLVQDYHLALVGAMLKDARPDLRTVHFTHTPFADPAMLHVLPDAVVDELLGAMAGFGACGFHTQRWERAFRAAYQGRGDAPSTFFAPLGPNPGALVEQASSPGVAAERERLLERVGARRLVVRVDRVELSKNILRGFWAFDELLARTRGLHDEVVMVALAYPSRQGLDAYSAYRSEVERTAAAINERWGSPQWRPVELVIDDNRDRALAALSLYDVLLVNPIRDGLNLVAKEGPLVNERDGMLVLSHEAGAWEELEGVALGVNPFDVSATASALSHALAMPAEQRADRARTLKEIVSARCASDWLHDQLEVAARLPKGP